MKYLSFLIIFIFSFHLQAQSSFISSPNLEFAYESYNVGESALDAIILNSKEMALYHYISEHQAYYYVGSFIPVLSDLGDYSLMFSFDNGVSHHLTNILLKRSGNKYVMKEDREETGVFSGTNFTELSLTRYEGV